MRALDYHGALSFNSTFLFKKKDIEHFQLQWTRSRGKIRCRKNFSIREIDGHDIIKSPSVGQVNYLQNNDLLVYRIRYRC